MMNRTMFEHAQWKKHLPPFKRWRLVGLMLLVLAGCASSEKQKQEASKNQQEPAREAESTFSLKASLAPDADGVQTVQLYGGNDEQALPILQLEQEGRLTLEFDLLGRKDRPLSVYFYHANRSWERDLSPSRYMNSYQRDELTDYELSRATEQPYVHYEYAFPNEDIGFEVSGNYVLRVTEQGDEDAVLFERAFFITEQSATSEFRLRRRRLGGDSLPGYQPILLFEPPSTMQGSSIFNYNTCFVPNGRFGEARCVSRPETLQQDALRFDLDPRQSFQVEGASYSLDLREIGTGKSVLEIDRSATPTLVRLEEDDVRFPGASGTIALTGQTLVSAGASSDNADLFGQYVQARFRFVPPKQLPLSRDVYLAGSSNGWRPTSKHKLNWNASERRYEGEILLKQGQYAYRYVSQDPKLRRVQRQTLPQTRSRFTAFIYYRDATLQTDRLLSVNETLAQ
jgi:hypothetical protein